MFQINQLRTEDTTDIVEIHLNAFKGFFLTNLGKNVLQVFYAALIEDKSTIAWGVKNEKYLVGFFVATTLPNGLYARIFKKHFFSFFIPLTLSFFKNLTLFKRMIISIKSSKFILPPSDYSSSLLSICVSPQFAGKGVGKILLAKLEEELMLQKKKGYYLTTDTENNDATNNFYLINQFDLFNVYYQGKRKMNIYIKKIG